MSVTIKKIFTLELHVYGDGSTAITRGRVINDFGNHRLLQPDIEQLRAIIAGDIGASIINCDACGDNMFSGDIHRGFDDSIICLRCADLMIADLASQDNTDDDDGGWSSFCLEEEESKTCDGCSHGTNTTAKCTCGENVCQDCQKIHICNPE